MTITVDGFVARPNGDLDWMTLEIDDKLREYVDTFTDSFDTILMGRKMAEGFVSYWTKEVDNPQNPWVFIARRMVDYPKIVFTKTLDKSPWPNTVLAKADIVDEVNRIKAKPGKDIVVYGGATFVSSLLKHNLIDEMNLWVNPVAIGEGMTIFKGLGDKFELKQLDATPYACGVTVHKYLPQQARAAAGG